MLCLCSPQVMLLSHKLMKSSIKNLAGFSANILTSVMIEVELAILDIV